MMQYKQQKHKQHLKVQILKNNDAAKTNKNKSYPVDLAGENDEKVLTKTNKNKSYPVELAGENDEKVLTLL